MSSFRVHIQEKRDAELLGGIPTGSDQPDLKGGEVVEVDLRDATVSGVVPVEDTELRRAETVDGVTSIHLHDEVPLRG